MPRKYMKLGRHFRALLLLAGPILLSQYAYLASGMADTIMSGSLGTVYQASVAVGSAIWVPVQMFITGTLYGVMIVISQHHGGDRHDELAATGRQGLWLALMLGLAGMGLLLLVPPNLTLFGVTPDVAEQAAIYLNYLVWGLPFSSLAIGMRFYCDGQKNVLPATIISIITVLVNIVLNYGLMFGNLGMPNMGVAGTGLATGISMALSALLFAAYVSITPNYRHRRLLSSWARPVWKNIGALAAVGLPIGIALISEFLVLSAIALCISTGGAVPIAAHQISFNFMMVLFAIPTSTAMATSILVANERGKGNRKGEQEAVLTSVAAGCGVGLALTITMWLCAETVAGVYSGDGAVISLATSILRVAALFQLVDAVQICLNGALRGIEDTVIPFLITSGTYWLLAFPLGYALSGMPLPFDLRRFIPDYGVVGWWFALVIGITLVALLLGRRVVRLFFGNRGADARAGVHDSASEPSHSGV